MEKMSNSDLQSHSKPSASSAIPRGADGVDAGRYSGLVASTVKYLLRTEVHTFAFSVAANAILSFFPFVLLLMTLIRRVFHSRVMYDVVVQLLRDFLPAGQDFVIRNLNALVGARNRAQVVSLLILLVTSTGIFMPLEVALNRIWRFPENRSYFGNQLISLGLAFGCGVLALLSIALTAENVELLHSSLRVHGILPIRLAGFLIMKIFAIAASIAIFFLTYWVLPNGKVPVRAVLPHGRDHGIVVGDAQIRLYPGSSPAEFSRSLRSVRFVGKPDVLGFPLRIASADGSAFVGAATTPASSLTSTAFSSSLRKSFGVFR